MRIKLFLTVNCCHSGFEPLENSSDFLFTMTAARCLLFMLTYDYELTVQVLLTGFICDNILFHAVK